MAPLAVLKVLGEVPLLFQAMAGALLLCIIYYTMIDVQRPYPGIPVIELDDKKSRSRRPDPKIYMMHAGELLSKGLRTTKGPFQIFTSSGYKIMLPNRFGDELRNNPDLSFALAGHADFHASLPGMEGLLEGFRPIKEGVLRDVVRVKLTQSLGLVTEDLSWLGDAKDWLDLEAKQFTLDVVAHVSSRIFGGKELARDKGWVDLTTQYTTTVMEGVHKLRSVPAIFRPIACRFIPECRKSQGLVREARRMAQPQVEKRMKIRDEAIAAGASPKSLPDVFSWVMEMAKGRPMLFAEVQLAMSLAAVHTTTETILRCLMALCDHPELQASLRKEMVEVLQSDGWAKTALYRMKLLDSFIKECQRLAPLATVSMMRVAEKAVVLSDGTVLPQNSFSAVIDNSGRDNNIFERPEKFDASRFLKMRERPGEENQHQLVATSTDHLAFGHGIHACPGRFFASNEVKIILCFLLIQYEWRYVPGQERLPFYEFETTLIANPATKLQARKRQAEVDVLQPMA